MGLFDIFKKKNTENKEAIFISNAGGMIISKSLLEGKSKLKWIFRENSNGYSVKTVPMRLIMVGEPSVIQTRKNILMTVKI